MSELRRQQNGDLIWFTSPQLSVYPRLKHAYFTRKGGVSSGIYESLNFRFTGTDSRDNLLQNYDIAARLVGGDVNHVIRTTQRHTDNIVTVSQPVTAFTNAGDGEEGVDALITNVPGAVLTGFYADCQLVMLYDHRHRACGVVHAGWRGIAQEIVRKTIEKMRDTYGCDPREMIAVVGPSICRSCFVTDDDVPDAMRDAFGGMVQEYMYRQDDKWCVDLKNITYAMLLRADIPAINIDISNYCPCCGDKTLWWSHRRLGENRGVHAGMICLTE